MRKLPLTLGLMGAGMIGAISLTTAGPFPTLGALCGAAIGLAGLGRPRFLVPLGLFAIYTNLSVVAVRHHGAPVAVAVLPVLVLAIPLAYYLLVRRDRVIVDDVFRLMLLFLGVLLVGSTLARDRGLALTWINVFLSEGILIYLLAVNVIRDRSMLRAAVWSLLLAGAFMSALCVYSELTHAYHTDFGGLVQRKAARDERPATAAGDQLEGRFATSRRAGGTIGEVNRFAQILLVLLPLAYFRFRGESRVVLRAAALLAGGLILGGVLLTYSRSGFLVLVGLVGLLTLTRHVRPATVVGLGVALLSLVLVVPGYRDRVVSIVDLHALGSKSAAVEADGAIRGRLTEMLAALRTFLDHPLLGVGPGQYESFYSIKYQVNSRDALRYIPHPRRAHNLYVEVAAETGVIGTLSFLAIPAMLLIRLRRVSKDRAENDPDLANLATACWFALVAYLAMGVFLHLAYQRYFWLLIALGGAAVQLSRSPVTHSFVTRPEPLHPTAEGLRAES